MKELFENLKQFFNSTEIPSTLSDKHIYISNVPESIRRSIRIISTYSEQDLELAVPSAEIERMRKIKVMMMDNSKWNTKQKPRSIFSNKLDIDMELPESKTDRKSRVKFRDDCEFLRGLGVYVHVENKSIAVPEHFMMSKEVKKMIDKMRLEGFQTQRSIV